METLFGWMAGFIAAFLTIRAVRGMWTTVGCLLVLSAGTAHAQLYSIQNTTGSYIQLYLCNAAGSVLEGPANIAPGAWYNQFGWGCGTYSIKINGTSEGHTCITAQYMCNPPGHTFYYPGSCNYSPPVTWFTNTIAFNNTNWFAGNYDVTLWRTNGTVLTNFSVRLDFDEFFEWSYGSTNDFTWSVLGPGGPWNDFMQHQVNAGDGEPDSSEPPPDVPELTKYDPFGQIPPRPPDGPAATNQAIADRQNSEAIVRAIQAGFGSLLSTNANTNGIGEYAAVLEAIRTNTFNTVGQLTNLNQTARGMSNALENLSTNLGALSGEALNTASNAISGAYDSLIGDWGNDLDGNAFGGGLETKAAGLAGQGADTNGWAATPADPEDQGGPGQYGPLDIPFSNGQQTYVLSLNPFSAMIDKTRIQTELTNFVAALGWLKYWFVLLIYFVLWWFMYSEVQAAFVMVQQSRMHISAIEIDWKSLAGKLTLGIIFQAALTTLVLTLPTYAATLMDDFTPLGSQNLPSSGPWASLSAGGMGGWSGVALAAYEVLGLVVPWATLWAAFANFLAFQLLKDKSLNWVMGALHTFKVTKGSAIAFGLFLIWPSRAEAVSVIVNNFASSSVAITNDSGHEVTFPPGQQFEFDLSPGTWYTASNNVTLEDSSWYKLVWNFYGSTNGVEMSVMPARSVTNAFMEGYAFGFWAFGIAWAVSYVRAGLRVSAPNTGT